MRSVGGSLPFSRIRRSLRAFSALSCSARLHRILPGFLLTLGLASTASAQPFLAYTALTDAPDPVVAGASLVYSVTVTNISAASPDNQNSVVLRLAATTYLSFAGDGGDFDGDCSVAAGIITCALGDLANNGDAFSGTVTLTVDPSAPDATVLAQDFDLYSTEQAAPGIDADRSTTVDAQADLVVVTAGPAQAVPGSNLVYTVTVTNSGPSDAQGVSVGLSVPAALPAPSSVTGNGCKRAPVLPSGPSPPGRARWSPSPTPCLGTGTSTTAPATSPSPARRRRPRPIRPPETTARASRHRSSPIPTFR